MNQAPQAYHARPHTQSRQKPTAGSLPIVGLLSVRQAARELGIAERTLRRAIRSGELPAIQPGKRTQYTTHEWVKEWIESTKVPTWRDRHAPEE